MEKHGENMVREKQRLTAEFGTGEDLELFGEVGRRVGETSGKALPPSVT